MASLSSTALAGQCPPSAQVPAALLVAQVGEGSSEALGELYDRYGGMLFAVAFRLTGTVQDAEDVVQDLFLGLRAALRAYEDRGNLEGWLKTLAVRASLMVLRSRMRRREIRLPDTSVLRSRSPDPSPIDRVQLERSLRALPETQRRVFVLRLEGYSHPEIAQLLHITTSASKVYLHRARQTLERSLLS